MTEFALPAMFGDHTQTFFSLGRKLKVLDVGGGNGVRAREEFYPDCEVTTIDIKNGWDVMKQGLPDGDWDIILANHFIEHISDPDYFLDECKRVMNEYTILEIGTPNLAAWFNRIFFLFGYVPHSVELSKRFNVGKPFDWNEEELGGHIYVQTVSSLTQLLIQHGFIIIEATGEHSNFKCNPLIKTVDRILTHVNINLASAFRIKCQYLP